MALNDTLSNALSSVYNAQQAGHREVIIRPSSTLIQKTLQIMQDNKYVGEVEAFSDRKGPLLRVVLIGRINKCGSIKPRHSVKRDEFEKFEARFLPARAFGVLIVSTPKGIVTHSEAKEKKLGGKLLAYCY